MQMPTCLHAGAAVTGIAVVGIAAMVAAPVAPVVQPHSPPTVAQHVRLAAATVPPGGLVTSFLGNQLIYCSIICPLLIETAVTPAVAALQTPGTFLTALQSGDLLKAIGVAAASVTGPTNAAAEATILADGSIPAKRALNAFEVGVVGLLNVIPAAAGGLPGIATAIETARQDTFTALNLPVVPNPTPTVMPQGFLQVAVVGAINVGGAVIFPAFNDVLSGLFETPDAIAQELAATGDPVLAVAAGVNTAAGVVTAAGTVIADSVLTALSNLGTPAITPAVTTPAITPAVTTPAITPAVTTPAITPAVTTPAITPPITAGSPALNIPTKVIGVLTTTAQQTIQVAISLALGGAVGAPIVLAGVIPAVQNFLANRNLGALLSAAVASELSGFGVAVGVVANAVAAAGTAIAGALNDPPATTLQPAVSKVQENTLVSQVRAAPATTTAPVVTQVDKPTGSIKRNAENTRTIGALDDRRLLGLPATVPTTQLVPQLLSAPAKTAAAVATQVGASTMDTSGDAAKAGGTDGKGSGDGSVGRPGRSVRGSHG
jgi:hypothetical protein